SRPGATARRMRPMVRQVLFEEELALLLINHRLRIGRGLRRCRVELAARLRCRGRRRTAQRTCRATRASTRRAPTPRQATRLASAAVPNFQLVTTDAEVLTARDLGDPTRGGPCNRPPPACALGTEIRVSSVERTS